MKDFEEFEKLLCSEEFQAEKKAFLEGAAERAAGKDDIASALLLSEASMLFTLRKYHEWSAL